MSSPRLSVVVPLFNEAANLRALAAEIRAALDPLALPYEVLFVDDGSTDEGPALLQQLALADPRIRVLRLARRAGQSAALAAGLRTARGEMIATLDADLQNDPADIPRLLDQLAERDLVCGVRVRRRDHWRRRASSRIANAVRNLVTGENISDVGCSLRIYRAEFARRMPMFDGMHRFVPTLVRLDGARIAQIPVSHRPRRHGKSKYNIRNRLWRALVDLLAVRWMQTRWLDRRLAEEVTPPPPDPPSTASLEGSLGQPSSRGRGGSR